MSFRYEYITTSQEVDAAVNFLQRVSIIGVDTEGDSLYRYQERVSLIQISGGDRHFIFDPLLLQTLTPVGSLLQDRSILKIFHGADYDLVSLKRDFGFQIGPLFDTTVAARILGIREFSLQHLIARFFQVTLSKAHQKSNWSIRPLPADQLEYAAQDTAYLIRLYEILKRDIEEKGRAAQVEEECRILESLAWSGKPFEPNDYLRIKGARALSPASQKVLRELAVVRDTLARKKDRPPFKIISGDDLLKMAKEPPRTLDDLKKLFPRETAPVFRHPSLWLEAVSKGLTTGEPLPKTERNGTVPLTADQEKRLTRLRGWRNRRAEEEGVEPAMVITSGVLEEVVRRMPETIEALRSIPSLRAWQIDRHGEALLRELTSPVTSPSRQNPAPPKE
ncbi:MAG: HRDC domain-containing protein [Candidatus Manganitrophaceae bacterium]